MSNESIGRAEIENRFGFHKATIEGPNATADVHRDIRRVFVDVAMRLDHVLPPGRAKAVAFTELETAAMWIHKAIAEQAPLVTDE